MNTESKKHCSKNGGSLLIFAIIVAFLLAVGFGINHVAPASAFLWLPFLMILFCPVMMMTMMHSGHQHEGTKSCCHSKHEEKHAEESDKQIDPVTTWINKP